MERHDRLAEPEQQPTEVCRSIASLSLNTNGAGLFVNCKISHHDPENIDATSSLFKQVSVLNLNHASAPYITRSANPLLKSAAFRDME